MILGSLEIANSTHSYALHMSHHEPRYYASSFRYYDVDFHIDGTKGKSKQQVNIHPLHSGMAVTQEVNHHQGSSATLPSICACADVRLGVRCVLHCEILVQCKVGKFPSKSDAQNVFVRHPTESLLTLVTNVEHN